MTEERGRQILGLYKVQFIRDLSTFGWQQDRRILQPDTRERVYTVT